MSNRGPRLRGTLGRAKLVESQTEPAEPVEKRPVAAKKGGKQNAAS